MLQTDYIVYHYLVFDNEFPVVRSAIKIDKDLHVQLQVYGNPVPLPTWFTQGRSAKLTTLSMLENFPNYLQNVISSDGNLIQKLQRRQHYKPKGRPPYSYEMIRFALLLRYTSSQAYDFAAEITIAVNVIVGKVEIELC